jgi:predicted transcriptional regulator
MSVVVSFRISRELKRKMDMLSYINWSEVVRKAIEEVVNRELSKLKSKDVEKLKMAALRSEELSRKVEGWNSVEEIRRWREKR